MQKVGVVAVVVLTIVGIAVLGGSGLVGLLILAVALAIATALVVRA